MNSARKTQNIGGFSVGTVRIEPPLLLAPMEDVTSQPFRRIAKRIGGPGFVFSEFVSAMALHYNAAKTFKKMRPHPDERPMGIQIFGGDPQVMAAAARLAEEAGADLVDINMGCWVPKVCRTGSGAALLKDPVLAQKIVESVVKAVQVPVTVKVRAGWDYSLFAAPELAGRFQDVGVKMLTLHARFAKQGFEGEADWSLISGLRKVLHIPLVGNGDLKIPADVQRMFQETGCDGVMVGRAAISNPWALARMTAMLRGEPEPPEPPLGERIETALEHVRRTIAFEAEKETFEEALELPKHIYEQVELRAIRSLRGQLPLYIKGVPGAAEIRANLSMASSYQEVKALLEAFLERCLDSVLLP